MVSFVYIPDKLELLCRFQSNGNICTLLGHPHILLKFTHEYGKMELMLISQGDYKMVMMVGIKSRETIGIPLRHQHIIPHFTQ